MMFSALKTLDPLDDEGQQAEEGDRDPDENHVGHQVLLGFGDGVTHSVNPRSLRRPEAQAGCKRPRRRCARDPNMRRGNRALTIREVPVPDFP